MYYYSKHMRVNTSVNVQMCECPQYIELGSVGSLSSNDCADQSSLRDSRYINHDKVIKLYLEIKSEH